MSTSPPPHKLALRPIAKTPPPIQPVRDLATAVDRLHHPLMSASSLQRKSVLCGGGFRYHCATAMPLSVKSFSGGTARYRTATGSHAVDEDSWLVLNDQEPYTIEFDSRSLIRSTVIFFPTGWAESVARVFRETDNALLDDPEAPGAAIAFIQTVTPDNGQIKPRLQSIDVACRGKAAPEDWLEEQLRELLATLLLSQYEHRTQANRLPAAKTVTRDELYRRLCRGRDFLHANACSAPTLDETARAASLSPFHFHRSFTAAFGLTPRRYAEARRLGHARRLLAREDSSATSIAAAVGYESYSAFHAAFKRQFGHPPTAAT